MQAPPFNLYLGIELLRHEPGMAEVAIDLQPHHLNRRGMAHGGVVASLLDSALGAAVISSIPEEWWCATTSLSTQFVAGASGRLTATGRVVRRGRHVAFASGEARDANDRVVATAQGTWHLWTQRPDRGSLRRSVVSARTGEAVRVGKIICVGRNFAEHVAEMGAAADRPPVVFLKPVTALAGDGDTILIPSLAGPVHHEVELVVVIGQEGKAIATGRALEHVLGYAVGIDLTLRELQADAKKRGEPWAIAKGFDGAAPVSTFVPREELGDAAGCEITLDVNGETRQRGNTSQMLNGIAELIAFVSRWMTLERGDLLFTGTPSGTGPVKPGDRLEARIENIGALHVAIEAEPAEPSE